MVRFFGYLGTGEYNSTSVYYKIWKRMIENCVKNNFELCEEWKNFQNFAVWSSKNNYNDSFKFTNLIIKPDSRYYSPDTSCYVPVEIFQAMNLVKSNRGKYMVGVSFDKDRQKFRSSISINGKPRNIGAFETELEAFEAYRIVKTKYLYSLAEKWKSFISKNCYLAIYNFEIKFES